MTNIMLKLLLLCLSSFLWTAVNTTNYSQPLDSCRGSDIDLLLVTYTLGNSTLQIQRLKNIVGHFLPEEKNETLRFRVHLLDIVNSTHSQHLIDFNYHKTTEDLTRALDNLIARESDNNISYHTRLNINAEEIFKRSSRNEATRLAIMLTQSYEQHTFEKSHRSLFFPRFEQTRNFPFYVYYIIDTSVSQHLDIRSDDNVLTVSGEEILLFNETVCGQCKQGWIALMKIGTRFPLSCFYISNTSYKRSNRQALLACKKMKADLVTLETKEELHVLEKHISAMEIFNFNVSTVFYVHVDFTKNKHSNIVNGVWNNGRPLTFEFSWDIFRGENYLNIRYLTWKLARSSRTDGYHGNVSDMDAQVDFTEQKKNLLICEYEVFRSFSLITTVTIEYPKDDSFLKVYCHPMFILINDTLLIGVFNFRKGDTRRLRTNYECHLDNSTHINIVCEKGNDCEIKNKCEEFITRSVELSQLLQCHKKHKSTSKYAEELQRSWNSELTDGGVEDYSDNVEQTCAEDCFETMCSNFTCLPSQWFSKLNPRQGLTISHTAHVATENTCFEDCRELLKYEIVFCDTTNKKVTSCSDFEGGRKLAPRCVYLKSSVKKETGCTDLSHLNDCQNFRCPEGLYKCPFSFCIPLYMINNGVQDCPYGEDENITIQGKNLFKCDGDSKHVYILPVHVCDKKTHCPYGDDENDCQMTCPMGFQCGWNFIKPAIPPAMIQLDSLNELNTEKQIVILSGIDLSNVRVSPRGTLRGVVQIHASRCNLEAPINIYFDPDDGFMVKYIDFSHNNIREIVHLKLFYDTINLQFLNLSHNMELNLIELDHEYISTLDLSFTNITSFNFTMKTLEHLNLSHTRVHVFYYPNNIKSMILVSLDVRSTELNIDLGTADSLAKLHVSSVFYCDHLKMCCPRISGTGIPFCVAPEEYKSTCGNILDDPVKRNLFWIIAVLSFVGNLTVLVFRFEYERAVITKGYRLFVTNLGLSDLNMGVYLIIIVGIYIHYGKDYDIYESEWRHSTLCSVAGFLATLSCETSAMFVFLITIERYLAVRFPFGTYRISRNLKFFLLILSWTVGLVLSLVPLVYQDWGIYSSNGMCLGLPMLNHQEDGRMYSFGAFLVLPGILFILIAVGQIAIFLNISGVKTFVNNATKQRREITIAKNLSLVITSNFLCCFTIFVFGLMAANGYDLSHELYSWLVVFVLPLNSAINPVLYTLPVLYKRWEEFKNGHAVK